MSAPGRRQRIVPFLAVTATALFALPAWAQQGGGYSGGGPHMWGDGWPGMIFGPLMMVFWLVVVVGAVVLLVRWLGGGSAAGGRGRGPGQGGRSPLDILKERYARGEIDDEEYARRRRVLED